MATTNLPSDALPPLPRSTSDALARLTPDEARDVTRQLRALAALPTSTPKEVRAARWLTEIADSLDA